MNEEKIVTRSEILAKFLHSKGGMAGACILFLLIATSIYAVVAVPLSTYNKWNDPIYWQDYPKTVPPEWSNVGGGLAKTQILSLADAEKNESSVQGIRTVSYTWKVNYDYNSFPSDFAIAATAHYSSTPTIRFDVLRPDGRDFKIYYNTFPPPKSDNSTTSIRILSSDTISSLDGYAGEFSCNTSPSKPQIMVFANEKNCSVLKGAYSISATFQFFTRTDYASDLRLVLAGQVFGLMGTDSVGRDLSIGILWGTPVALFIGLSVAVASTIIGLIYGVISGYKGRYADEGMMRVSDIFYSLPFLPLLIILSISLGRSIFLFVGFLVLLGWVGMAKIGRSLSLQIKSLPYVEAAKLMGESDFKVIRRHVIPQLVPIAFASIAISVPTAILGEAALSFLGLGDPTIPTWGRILHDAQEVGAITNGWWWWTLLPGFMIALTGAAFVLIGNSLNAIVDPRARPARVRAVAK